MQNESSQRKDPTELSRLQAKPFVKWVGGKTQLLPELLKRVPQSFDTYYEPFIGGGALFFALQPRKAVLSDLNNELIDCYNTIRSNVEPLVFALGKHIHEEAYFYQLREQDRSEEYSSWSRIDKASRLLYLNKTCYNGLYRVNSKGQFNTPFGSYKNPRIVDAENLRACSQILANTELRCCSFEESLANTQKGDFVYIDPPYVPLSDTAYFTSYSKDGFGPDAQRRLRDTCIELDKKGVFFLASNSSTDFVQELYSQFKIEGVQASRAINSKASKRGKIEEFLISNY
ncbi:UNVERIFIED_CONTAM: hypothetical protein GTU68_018386 [Idotea baltica]|nr:hypothetical protein [Idotea baltica]